MSTDFFGSPVQSSQYLPRIRFSLLAVLFFMTLVCLGLGYVFRPRYCSATALFHVGSQKHSMWNDPHQLDAHEFEVLQNTQIRLIKSYFVLQSAVRDPRIAGLPLLAGM